MAANPKSLGDTDSRLAYTHFYHAEAHVFSTRLEHPIKQPLESYGRVVLEKSRRQTHVAQKIGETSIEGLISFKSGHTRVIGAQIKNKTDVFGNDHAGWVTLSTAVLEGLNIVDILTADRVVAQVSTEHPMKDGNVPKVTFLGTHFENLRIGGYPVEVEVDLGICGNKPVGDRPYLADEGFLNRVMRQLEDTASTKGFPVGLENEYDDRISGIGDLKKRANGGAKGKRNGYSKVQCSLVKSIGPIPIPGVKTFGNLIFIPNFGTLALAELEVGIGTPHVNDASNTSDASSNESGNSNYFTLHMLNLTLGCPVGGSGKGPSVTSNGNNGPG
jgi:hypothetical protein